LAEAFWLLEGYFVRTLGMHRVYNSAFMNMLRDEENAKYRSYLKKTIEFDPDILKRYVNFMSNPDERTAIDQFGSGDRYFGVCTLLATLPGLPMFGHGQIEAFTEKYGMEYKQARMEEWPNEDLVARHQREIAPLLKNRWLFAGSSDFFLYDFWTESGTVDENVFAYSNICYGNRSTPERAIIFFNNRYGGTRGTIHSSAESMDKANGTLRSKRLNDALHLTSDDAVIVAYKDAATGLEYLRRSRDIDHHGLPLELRAYQYVVLQNWRELRSTATEPWDRLCDALNGTGVYNLEEALSKLRLQPLHEALRQLLSPPGILTIIDLAGESSVIKEAPASPAAGPDDLPLKSKAIGKPAGANGFDHVDISQLQKHEDPRLAPLFEKSRRFYSAIEQMESIPAHASPEAFQAQVTASIHALIGLPTRASTIDWPKRAESMLPLGGSLDAPLAVWAPVLAWSVLRHLNATAEGNLTLFDQLQLRSALAETFSSLGIEGEDSWRAAARVRLLLSLGFRATGAAFESLLRSQQFWDDPDARWLLGLGEFRGQTFFNKELFEELACWLLLPDLISRTAAKSVDLEDLLQSVFLAAESAGYEVAKFIALLHSPIDPPKQPKAGTDTKSASGTTARSKVEAGK
jgi:hypothetical protein